MDAAVLWRVCLCVCVSFCPQRYLRNHTRDLYHIFVHAVCLSRTTRAIFTKLLVHVVYGRSSIYFKRRGEICYLRFDCIVGICERTDRHTDTLSEILLPPVWSKVNTLYSECSFVAITLSGPISCFSLSHCSSIAIRTIFECVSTLGIWLSVLETVQL